MRRINFDNETTDDDIKLLALLKDQIEEPSNNLVNKTMERWITSKQHKKYPYTPLRIPVYIMSLALILLFIPLFLPIELKLETPEINFPVDTVVEYSVYTWLTISLMLVLSIVMRISFKSLFKTFNIS